MSANSSSQKRVHFSEDGSLVICDGCHSTYTTKSAGGDARGLIKAMQEWIEAHHVCVPPSDAEQQSLFADVPPAKSPRVSLSVRREGVR